MSRSKDGAGVVASVLNDRTAEAVLVGTITGQKPGDKDDAATDGEPQESQQSITDLTSAASELQLEPQQVDPKQLESIAKVDRENALILCTKLMENLAGDLPPEKVALLQSLMRDGTQLVISDRARAQPA
jgi:hypothetical protein